MPSRTITIDCEGSSRPECAASEAPVNGIWSPQVVRRGRNAEANISENSLLIEGSHSAVNSAQLRTGRAESNAAGRAKSPSTEWEFQVCRGNPGITAIGTTVSRAYTVDHIDSLIGTSAKYGWGGPRIVCTQRQLLPAKARDPRHHQPSRRQARSAPAAPTAKPPPALPITRVPEPHPFWKQRVARFPHNYPP